MKTSDSFDDIIKKQKRKNWFRTVVLACLISLVSLCLALRGLAYVTKYQAEKVKKHYLLLSEIAYPNTYSTFWGFEETSYYTGIFKANRLKDLAGVVVPFEDVSANYSLSSGDTIQSTWIKKSPNKTSTYTQNHHYKTPMFFNKNFSYQENDSVVTQDMALTKDMPNQVLEMAVTFDKPYTQKEIQDLIPKNLNINWYWIGTDSRFDTSELPPSDIYGLTADKGQLSPEVFTQFRRNLKKAISEKQLPLDIGYASEGNSYHYDPATDLKDYMKENKTIENATFSGVVLTGRAEDFASLENKSWLFGANIGQSATIQPYDSITITRNR